MIILSFRTKKDKEHMLEKAKEMEAYASELVDCLEEAKHGDHDEYEEDDYMYSERGYRGGASSGSSSRMMRGRYGYGRR